MIDIIARIMCMRNQVVDKDEVKNNQRKQMKLTNKDRVHGEPLNERLMYSEEDGFRLTNGTPNMNAEQFANIQQELKSAAALEKDIKEIKSYMRTMMNKHLQKEAKDKIAREWKLVAVVLDRLFFFAYLLIIIVSILTVFDFVLFGGNAEDWMNICKDLW